MNLYSLATWEGAKVAVGCDPLHFECQGCLERSFIAMAVRSMGCEDMSARLCP